jgi:F-type H+-transporting ATPase subunit delta
MIIFPAFGSPMAAFGFLPLFDPGAFAALESKVLAKVATLSNKKITIENNVDPSIIGGFILRIGDKQYNASVANRLQVLKRELSN